MFLKSVYALSVMSAFVVIAAVTSCTARADDAKPTYSCPPKVASCKIVIMTPDEEQTLVGPEMIFAHAQWANHVKLDSLIQAWVEKLRQAPQGVVAPATEDKK